MTKRKKVFVGVSGGVDSSVALALLKQQGYDVTGVFLKVWYPDFMPCDWKEERLSAMRVCATLNVPFITIDCEKEYKKEVVDYMIREYKGGRVPNPDIFCNKYVKFGVFLQKALEMGADFIATGHYAIRYEYKSENNTNVYELRESRDKEKDQSYFLYTLDQDQLSRTLFPVGHLTKPEVRKLAQEFGLSTANKKDSQGLCFMGNIDIKEFLSHYIEVKKGDVLNTDGEMIGYHDGAQFLTIGQRHGFTITKKSAEDPRFFVVKKDLEKNTITVASKELEIENIDNIKGIIIKDFHFVSEIVPKLPLQTSVRIRYRQEKRNCIINKGGDFYEIAFAEPQNAISVGQSAVFYTDEVCLGGGVIESIF
ncbi:MAG: tRNA-specific 2-thiouridylase [Parcubacteria group bacterium Gr01-1014_46]|nr:MAG: tRNA-specific 2-thiouridylase [Parcubacteria group bacterium Gr01-1014_46]